MKLNLKKPIMDFFIAKQKHSMWYIKAKAYLLDMKEFDFNEGISHTECELGQWINSKTIEEKFNNNADFIQLKTTHEKMHNALKEAIELKNKNKTDMAHEKASEIKKKSDEIKNLLDKLQLTNAII